MQLLFVDNKGPDGTFKCSTSKIILRETLASYTTVVKMAVNCSDAKVRELLSPCGGQRNKTAWQHVVVNNLSSVVVEYTSDSALTSSV